MGAVRCLILLSLAFSLGLSAQAKSAGTLVVDPARTRVLIAQVMLTVSDLTSVEIDGRLTLKGRYEIEVPLRKSKNETGELFLPFAEAGESIFSEGGELGGWCDSETFPDSERLLYCRFTPDEAMEGVGRLDLHIDLGNRIVKFVTEYRFDRD